MRGDSVVSETLNIVESDDFIEIVKNISFYSIDFVAAQPVKEEVVIETVKEEIVVQPIGEQSIEGLIFKVQIAAYNLPKNYNYARLKGLGDVEKNLLDDNITRFTIGGSFKTLNLANEHRDKVIARGQDDTFVTAIYKGKRVYLKDLVAQGIIKE